MATGPGQTLSHYRLIEKIGEGGMGVVWKAEDTVLNRTVAIKVLPAEVSRDEQRRQMFLQEAQLAAQVGDAHIVQVHEFGREGDLDFIVMEYVEGRPLNKLIQGRPMPPAKVAELGSQVAKALSRAHRKGLLHRDLKPANILVSPDGDVKVVDFGLAALFRAPGSVAASETPTRSAVTRTREEEPPRGLAGTLPYMSPEQVRGEKLDSRSDIFSLGTVLYEMTTGRKPFEGASMTEVAQEILKASSVPPHELVPKLPLELDRIIQKSLGRRQADRYQHMDDLAVDLSRLRRELESGSSPSYEDLAKTAVPKHRPRRLLVGIAGAFALLAIVLGVWWFGFRPSGGLDERRILILPMAVRGQEDGGDYVGQAFAEAIAVNLAQHEELRVSPVPETTETEGEAMLVAARRHGAARVVAGKLTRDGATVHASVQLLNPAENLILWGTQETVRDNNLPSLASSMARALVVELGVLRQKLYPYVWDLTGSATMAQSPELLNVISTIQTPDEQTALTLVEKLVTKFPQEPDAHALKSLILYNVWERIPASGNKMVLEASIELMDRLDPENPYGPMFRAFLFGEGEGRLQEAIETYSELLKRRDLTPRMRSWVLRNRGWSFGCLGRQETALRDLEEALQLDPLHSYNHDNLAAVLSNFGRFEEATVQARMAVALLPNSYQHLRSLAYALYHSGEVKRAVSHLETACELSKDQSVWAFLAAGQQRLGRSEEARAALEVAMSQPDNADGHFHLARYYLSVGDVERALSYLASSVRFGVGWHSLRDDPDFVALHGHAEFDAIVAVVRNRFGED